MALERLIPLITAYFPTFTNDVIGVYDKNFNQVFRNARPLKASIKPTSKVMEHPLEDGSVVADHSIFNPIEIELLLMLSSDDYVDTYETIRNLYENREILTVQTFSGSYENQVIYDISHEESRDIFSALSMIMKLKQVQFVKPEFSIAPKNNKNSNTVDKGTQIPKPVQTSAGKDIKNNLLAAK